MFINDSIRVIRQLKLQGKTPDEIEKEVPLFARDYPTLYKMVLKINLKRNLQRKTLGLKLRFVLQYYLKNL